MQECDDRDDLQVVPSWDRKVAVCRCRGTKGRGQSLDVLGELDAWLDRIERLRTRIIGVDVGTLTTGIFLSLQLFFALVHFFMRGPIPLETILRAKGTPGQILLLTCRADQVRWSAVGTSLAAAWYLGHDLGLGRGAGWRLRCVFVCDFEV